MKENVSEELCEEILKKTSKADNVIRTLLEEALQSESIF